MARILVVDDEPDLRLLVKEILQDAGHTVLTASDGKEAVTAVAESKPDLMVLDIMMPHMDGHGVLKSLKRLGLRDSTKTLVLTCKGQEVDWFEGYKSGAHQYLTKPFDPQELVDSVHRLLGMSPQQLNAHRDTEYDRAQLLSRLEGLLG